MTEKTRIFMLINADTNNLTFEGWKRKLHLRFKTNPWRSNLDDGSYRQLLGENGGLIGIVVDVPFPLLEPKFIQRMERVLNMIASWWLIPLHCAESHQQLPAEMYWVLMRNTNVGEDFDDWVLKVQKQFDEKSWDHNICNGHEVIRDVDGIARGIYVKMPFPMSFQKFRERMSIRTDIMFEYYTKTTCYMPPHEMTACYEYGFFS